MFAINAYVRGRRYGCIIMRIRRKEVERRWAVVIFIRILSALRRLSSNPTPLRGISATYEVCHLPRNESHLGMGYSVRDSVVDY